MGGWAAALVWGGLGHATQQHRILGTIHHHLPHSSPLSPPPSARGARADPADRAARARSAEDGASGLESTSRDHLPHQPYPPPTWWRNGALTAQNQTASSHEADKWAVPGGPVVVCWSDAAVFFFAFFLDFLRLSFESLTTIRAAAPTPGRGRMVKAESGCDDRAQPDGRATAGRPPSPAATLTLAHDPPRTQLCTRTTAPSPFPPTLSFFMIFLFPSCRDWPASASPKKTTRRGSSRAVGVDTSHKRRESECGAGDRGGGLGSPPTAAGAGGGVPVRHGGGLSPSTRGEPRTP